MVCPLDRHRPAPGALTLTGWLEDLTVDANRDAERWGALADGTRRAMVACLADGPRPVGELAAGLPVSRSAVSQHLKILKDAGLVDDVAAGTRRIYRLNPAALAALRDQLDTYWQRALTAYAKAVGVPARED
jgi:DNA-binding transcriptional ArsR family regulator